MLKMSNHQVCISNHIRERILLITEPEPESNESFFCQKTVF